MEATNQSEANRHKNYRLKQYNHVASLHEYCAERDATVNFLKRRILRLQRNNKRLRRQNDWQRKLATRHQDRQGNQEEKEHLSPMETESALLAALLNDDIGSGGPSDDPQLSSVPAFIEDGKDQEMQAEKSMGILENLERKVEVHLQTHAFPEEVFQDPYNSDDVQQFWKDKFQEDTMSPVSRQNPHFNHAEADTHSIGSLSPMDFPLNDEDLFDGRLD